MTTISDFPPSALQPLGLRLLTENHPALPHGPTMDLPERIIQFGEGNFLRGFADWMVDAMNRKGLFQGRVVVVQPVRKGMADALNAQDGVYTLLLRGIQGGTPVEDRSIITSISRCLNPYEDWQAVVHAALQPALRFAISNTTEAGIVYQAEAYDGVTSPASFPAKVTALLLERFRALGGGDATGLVFLPCELIDKNGAKLRECVLRHAAEWRAGDEFIAWIQSANHFLNTLVDRIVPGYPAAEAARLREDLGYEDRLMVAAEIFHLWVIEGPSRLADEIPFLKAGLNVIWTDDMTPYRSRKVRVLNGAHTSSVPSAFLAGFNTVGEMMNDPEFGPLVGRAVFEEILPVLDMDEVERRSYADAVVERFLNPYIKHELISIMLNCVSKWKVRVLPSLLDGLAKTGTLPPVLTFSLASLIRFYDGEPVSETELRGHRNGAPYPILDDAPVLRFFHDQWTAYRADHDADRLVRAVLSNTNLWGTDLHHVPGLAGSVTRSLENILRAGAKQAILPLA